MSPEVKSALLELCRTRLKENGITFWTSGDEQEILKILDYIRKPYTTAPLSPAATFFRRGEFFWIVFEVDGEPVGVSALRYDPRSLELVANAQVPVVLMHAPGTGDDLHEGGSQPHILVVFRNRNPIRHPQNCEHDPPTRHSHNR